MADPNPTDQLSSVMLSSSQFEVMLTFHFNGGSTYVSVDDGTTQKTYTFAADPFFRRQNHNISVGSLMFRIPPPPSQDQPEPVPPPPPPIIITLQFANMFPIDQQPPSDGSGSPTVEYYAELSSLRDQTSLKTFGGQLAFNQEQSIGILLGRA